MSESVRVAEKKSEAAKEDTTSQTRKSDYSQPVNPSIDRILFLQRTIGNQAVGRLIKSGALQAKLKIGQPDDIYEQEADRVAEQAMQMSNFGDTRIQRKCPKCEEELRRQPEEKKEELQAKEIPGDAPEVSPHIEVDIRSMRGGGQPLPESVRAFYEPRFGRDFSGVRVHTDAKAAESARAVNAQAYTIGRDIVFGVGRYVPTTREGQRLLAHELTHTIQQEAKAPTTAQQLMSTSPEDVEERQARAASDAVALGNAVPIVSQSGQQLARQDDDAGPADASLPGGVMMETPPESPPSPDDQSLGEEGTDGTNGQTVPPLEPSTADLIIDVAKSFVGSVDYSKPDPDDPTKRFGWQNLKYIFMCGAGEDLKDNELKRIDAQPEGENWCGIFGICCFRAAGVNVKWNLASGGPEGSIKTVYSNRDLMYGDMAQIEEHQHLFIVVDIDWNSGTIESIDGNTEYGQIKHLTTHKLKEVRAYYRAL